MHKDTCLSVPCSKKPRKISKTLLRLITCYEITSAAIQLLNFEVMKLRQLYLYHLSMNEGDDEFTFLRIFLNVVSLLQDDHVET